MTGNALKTLQVANVVGLLGTLTSNALANALPVGGVTTGEVADSYPNLFVPAGLTFAIWGLIYVLLVVFTAYQARGVFGRLDTDAQVVRSVGPWFLVASAANAGWIFAFHFKSIVLSQILIVVLTAALLTAYLRLGIGAREASAVVRWAVFVPFSVYLGWLTVATVANTTALLVDVGWQGFGLSQSIWTIIVIGVGAGVGLWAVFSRADIPFALVIVWAYAGIVIKRADAGDAPSVVLAASVAGAIVLLDAVFIAVRRGLYVPR